jgi:hypothetical protein
MVSPYTVNSTLAMPVATCDRTSHSPGSSLRMSGIPIGQPNCAVLMSKPTARRTSRSNPASHSRTGSLPVVVRRPSRPLHGRLPPCPAEVRRTEGRQRCP